MAEFQFFFHPEAELEFIAAFEWYWGKNHSTANAFDDAVIDAIGLIRRNPAVWPVYLHGTQKFVVRKFPYNIAYRQNGERLEIIAVAHQRRRPGYWVDRLDEV
jgi:plasmid stabilization system protein ParE